MSVLMWEDQKLIRVSWFMLTAPGACIWLPLNLKTENPVSMFDALSKERSDMFFVGAENFTLENIRTGWEATMLRAEGLLELNANIAHTGGYKYGEALAADALMRVAAMLPD